MKSELLLITIVVGLALLGLKPEESKESLFESWARLHKKSYSSPQIKKYRRSVFEANLHKIKQHNQNPSKTYSLGVTIFADLTEEQFRKIYLNKYPYQPRKIQLNYSLTADVDWVARGYTTSVKAQGYCNSGWAFAATGALEALSKQRGGLQSFSQQQLIDCSRGFGNIGCSAGSANNAFAYVSAKGITTQSAFPYAGRDSVSCKLDGGAFKISQTVSVIGCNGLASAINSHVVAVAVDSDYMSLYSSGVFNKCNTTVNHGTLLVGVKNGTWWIKNSWGTSWGEQGFIRLAAGDTCGVCQIASYPE